jgi:hypothetical protein
VGRSHTENDWEDSSAGTSILGISVSCVAPCLMEERRRDVKSLKSTVLERTGRRKAVLRNSELLEGNDHGLGRGTGDVEYGTGSGGASGNCVSSELLDVTADGSSAGVLLDTV